MRGIQQDLRRVAWWMACADPEALASAGMPRSEGIKQAVIGYAVAATTFLAAGGWTYQGIMIFGGGLGGVAAALGLGLLMGCIMLVIERAVIASIRPHLSLRQKVMAFTWRFVIGTLDAAIITLPVALGHFQNAIVSQLNDEQVAQLQVNRQRVAQVFGLNERATAVKAITGALDQNRTQRSRLPASVQALSTRSAACAAGYARLRDTIEPRIVMVTAQLVALDRLPASERLSANTVSEREDIVSQLSAWRRTLDTKARDCANLARQFGAAKHAYYSDIDSKYGALLAEKNQAQGELNTAKREAEPVLKKSDAVAALNSAPDIGARLRGLRELFDANPHARSVILVFYSYFLLVCLWPAISKLTTGATGAYPTFILAQERRLLAELNAETIEIESHATIRAEKAVGEVAAFRRLAQEGGGRYFLERVREQAKLDAEKTRVLAPFRSIYSLLSGSEELRNRLDKLEARNKGNEQALHDIEAIRLASRATLRSAARAMDQERDDVAAE